MTYCKSSELRGTSAQSNLLIDRRAIWTAAYQPPSLLDFTIAVAVHFGRLPWSSPVLRERGLRTAARPHTKTRPGGSRACMRVVHPADIP